MVSMVIVVPAMIGVIGAVTRTIIKVARNRWGAVGIWIIRVPIPAVISTP